MIQLFRSSIITPATHAVVGDTTLNLTAPYIDDHQLNLVGYITGDSSGTAQPRSFVVNPAKEITVTKDSLTSPIADSVFIDMTVQSKGTKFIKYYYAAIADTADTTQWTFIAGDSVTITTTGTQQNLVTTNTSLSFEKPTAQNIVIVARKGDTETQISGLTLQHVGETAGTWVLVPTQPCYVWYLVGDVSVPYVKNVGCGWVPGLISDKGLTSFSVEDTDSNGIYDNLIVNTTVTSYPEAKYPYGRNFPTPKYDIKTWLNETWYKGREYSISGTQIRMTDTLNNVSYFVANVRDIVNADSTGIKKIKTNGLENDNINDVLVISNYDGGGSPDNLPRFYVYNMLNEPVSEAWDFSQTITTGISTGTVLKW